MLKLPQLSSSKTISFNIYQLLLTALLMLGTMQWWPNLPHWLFVVIAVLGWIISQAITYITPSGEFVGHGQNWSIGKWVERIGLSVIAIFALMTDSGIGAMAAALLQPLVEIIIRQYGSATEKQVAAARMMGKIS